MVFKRWVSWILAWVMLVGIFAPLSYAADTVDVTLDFRYVDTENPGQTIPLRKEDYRQYLQLKDANGTVIYDLPLRTDFSNDTVHLDLTPGKYRFEGFQNYNFEPFELVVEAGKPITVTRSLHANMYVGLTVYQIFDKNGEVEKRQLERGELKRAIENLEWRIIDPALGIDEVAEAKMSTYENRVEFTIGKKVSREGYLWVKEKGNSKFKPLREKVNNISSHSELFLIDKNEEKPTLDFYFEKPQGDPTTIAFSERWEKAEWILDRELHITPTLSNDRLYMFTPEFNHENNGKSIMELNSGNVYRHQDTIRLGTDYHQVYEFVILNNAGDVIYKEKNDLIEAIKKPSHTEIEKIYRLILNGTKYERKELSFQRQGEWVVLDQPQEKDANKLLIRGTDGYFYKLKYVQDTVPKDPEQPTPEKPLEGDREIVIHGPAGGIATVTINGDALVIQGMSSFVIPSSGKLVLKLNQPLQERDRVVIQVNASGKAGMPSFQPIQVEHVVEKSRPLQTIAGEDRYETSVLLSQAAFKEADTVILASGEGGASPDALAAGPLSEKEHAPILLTEKSRIPSVVLREIRRLSPKKLIVLGGENTISESSLEEIHSLFDQVERIYGKDRYETSVAIAQAVAEQQKAETVVLANGVNLVDALSVNPYAMKQKAPILLTGKENVPSSVQNWIDENKPSKITLVGGESSLPKALENSLGRAKVQRLAGENRYETARVILKELQPKNVVLASGMVTVDALAAAPYAHANSAAILLVEPNRLGEASREGMKEISPGKVIVVGGRAVVQDGVYRDLRNEFSLK